MLSLEGRPNTQLEGTTRMTHRYQKPLSQLSKYIRTILIVEGLAQNGSDELPIFTNGMSALICKTEKDPDGGNKILQLTLYGNSIPPEVLNVADNTTLIVYFFYPFLAAPLFNIPARKLKASVDFNIWNAHKCNALSTQLFFAETTERKIEILNNVLIQQLRENERLCEMIVRATDTIMCDPQATILSTIQQELNITERTFQRMFKRYIGITPNQYRRICQFQLSFSQVRSGQFDSLSDVAYDNDYADQSHFNRAFKEFARTTPHKYLKTGLTNKK